MQIYSPDLVFHHLASLQCLWCIVPQRRRRRFSTFSLHAPSFYRCTILSWNIVSVQGSSFKAQLSTFRPRLRSQDSRQAVYTVILNISVSRGFSTMYHRSLCLNSDRSQPNLTHDITDSTLSLNTVTRWRVNILYSQWCILYVLCTCELQINTASILKNLQTNLIIKSDFFLSQNQVIIDHRARTVHIADDVVRVSLHMAIRM